MRIGFLFNHDALHQVRHTAPVIAAMADDPRAEITVLTSSPVQEAEVRALIGGAADRVAFVALSIGRGARLLDRALGRIVPFRRVAVLRENLDAFASLDVLVTPETTSLMLRDRFGLRDLKFVWIPHGAGDRSIGFRDEIRRIDLVLLSGRKVADRMLAAGLVTPDSHAIVGYPKFDTVDPATPGDRPFANDRPTVLYNPHFDPRLSSWYDWGPAIVDWFAGQDRFNLIVAPHVMLAKRRWHASVEHRRIRRVRTVPPPAAPTVLIDLGSDRSVDMTYARAADIYLGDASSQIYEWIARPRPAVFLDPGHHDWHNNPDFAHWRLGEVVERLADLPAALDRAVLAPDAFAQAQRAAFANTFSMTGTSAGRRAAAAILDRFG